MQKCFVSPDGGCFKEREVSWVRSTLLKRNFTSAIFQQFVIWPILGSILASFILLRPLFEQVLISDFLTIEVSLMFSCGGMYVTMQRRAQTGNNQVAVFLWTGL